MPSKYEHPKSLGLLNPQYIGPVCVCRPMLIAVNGGNSISMQLSDCDALLSLLPLRLECQVQHAHVMYPE